TAAGDTGRGVYGEASITTGGPNYGGSFLARGTGASAGVRGEASNAGAYTNYGGYFTAAGTSFASGVYGEASGAGTVYGVSGAASNSGAFTNMGGAFSSQGTGAGASGVRGYAYGTANDVYGVYGQANSTGAYTNYGGYFLAQGATGIAVRGEANNIAAINYGGYFTAAGVGGYGVYGYAADATAVANYGGYFKASGQGGYGTYGYASEATAVNYGVYGQADGPAGYGFYGYAANVAGGNYGGYFEGASAASYGVYGKAPGTGGYGVYGWASNAAATNYGGYFKSDGAGGYGVYATATNATGPNYGGFFQATGANSFGVYAAAPDSTALAVNFGGYFVTNGVGTGTAGVYGQASGAGVVAGVYGLAADSGGGTANYGGYFEAGGQGGARGVYGKASGVGGTNYGVYGDVTSAVGWAGYFTGGNGLYTSRISVADNTSGVGYNTIGTPGASHTAGGEINDSSDLFIASSLEVDGAAWFDGGHTDLAEMVAYNGEGEAGDVIVIDENNDNAARIATRPYDKSVLGIISTKPTLIITGDIEEGKLMAVAGRVPTKVTNINGAIHRGDLLTTSSLPGRAMKATKVGPTVGKAMGECDKNECIIWVFVNVSWYGGASAETASNDCAAVSCSEIISNSVEDVESVSDGTTLIEKLKMLWEKLFE
ncbi:MAG: hypothetical protein ABII19_01780, partial [Patescibacteria group bacterium]